MISDKPVQVKQFVYKEKVLDFIVDMSNVSENYNLSQQSLIL